MPPLTMRLVQYVYFCASGTPNSRAASGSPCSRCTTDCMAEKYMVVCKIVV